MANSDGCRLNGPRFTQRAAPFTVSPMTGNSIITKMAPSRPSTAMRRTPRGDSSDVSSMIVTPPVAKTIIRQE